MSRSPSPVNRSHVNYNETRACFGSPRPESFSSSRSRSWSSGTPSHVQSPYQYPDYDPARNIFGRSTPVSMNTTTASWGGNQSWPRSRVRQNATTEGLPYATPARRSPRVFNQTGLTSFSSETPPSYEYSGYSGGSFVQEPYQYPDYDPAKCIFGRSTPISMNTTQDSWGGQQTWPGARARRTDVQNDNNRSRYTRGMGSMPNPHRSPSRLNQSSQYSNSFSPRSVYSSGFSNSGKSANSSYFMSPGVPTSTPRSSINQNQTYEISAEQRGTPKILDPVRDRTKLEGIIKTANYKDRCKDQRRLFNLKQERAIELFESIMRREDGPNPEDIDLMRQNFMNMLDQDREEFEKYLHDIRPGGPGSSYLFDESDEWDSHTPYTSGADFPSNSGENTSSSSGSRRVVQTSLISNNTERHETTTVLEDSDNSQSNASDLVNGFNNAIDELIIRQIETMKEILKAQKNELSKSNGRASPGLAAQHHEVIEEINRLNTEEINHMVSDLIDVYESEMEHNGGQLIRIQESTRTGPDGVISERTETVEESPSDRRQERMPLPPENASVGEFVMVILHNYFLNIMRMKEEGDNAQNNIELMEQQLKVKEEIRLIIEIFKTKYRNNITDPSSSFTQRIERSVSEGSIQRRETKTTKVRHANEVEIERLTNLLSRMMLKHRQQRQAFLQRHQQEKEQRGESNDLNAKHQAEMAAFDDSQMYELLEIQQQIHGLREAMLQETGEGTSARPNRFQSAPIVGGRSTPLGTSTPLRNPQRSFGSPNRSPINLNGTVDYSDQIRSDSGNLGNSSLYSSRLVGRIPNRAPGHMTQPRFNDSNGFHVSGDSGNLTLFSPQPTPRHAPSALQRRPENRPPARMMDWARQNNVAIRPESPPSGPRTVVQQEHRVRIQPDGVVDEITEIRQENRPLDHQNNLNNSTRRRNVGLMNESMPSFLNASGPGIMDESTPRLMGQSNLTGRSSPISMNTTSPNLMERSGRGIIDESFPSFMNASGSRSLERSDPGRNTRGRYSQTVTPRRPENRPPARMMEWARQNNAAVRPDSFNNSSGPRRVPQTSTPIRRAQARPTQIRGIAVRPDSFTGDMPPARAFMPTPPSPARIQGIRPDTFNNTSRYESTRMTSIHDQPSQSFTPLLSSTMRDTHEQSTRPNTQFLSNIHEQSTQIIDAPDLHEETTQIIDRRSPGRQPDLNSQNSCVKSCPCCLCRDSKNCGGRRSNNGSCEQSLDEMELSEQEELRRCLKKWQNARRDVLTSISSR